MQKLYFERVDNIRMDPETEVMPGPEYTLFLEQEGSVQQSKKTNLRGLVELLLGATEDFKQIRVFRKRLGLPEIATDTSEGSFFGSLAVERFIDSLKRNPEE